MTGKELESIRNIDSMIMGQLLRENRLNAEFHAKCLVSALACISMMHSILIYDYQPTQAEFPFPETNKYLKQYIELFGMTLIKMLWEDQVKDFKKATVNYGSGVDGEGCIYNSCDWEDD